MSAMTFGAATFGAATFGASIPGTIKRTIRDPQGGVVVILDNELAAALAAGFIEIAPPYVDMPDDRGAWDTGPLYVIAHADGRQYAVTINNYANYYAPVGFFLIGPELPTIVVPGGATRTTQAGDTRITDVGDIRITAV